MKKMRKIVATTLALGMAFTGLVACGPQQDNSGKTVINVMNTAGGNGRAWLDQAAARFEEANKDVSFEDGKTGVKIEIENNLQTGVETMKSANYHIYTDQGAPTARSLSASQSVLDITDMVTEKSEVRNGQQISIEDKIQDEYSYRLDYTRGRGYRSARARCDFGGG